MYIKSSFEYFNPPNSVLIKYNTLRTHTDLLHANMQYSFTLKIIHYVAQLIFVFCVMPTLKAHFFRSHHEFCYCSSYQCVFGEVESESLATIQNNFILHRFMAYRNYYNQIQNISGSCVSSSWHWENFCFFSQACFFYSLYFCSTFQD